MVQLVMGPPAPILQGSLVPLLGLEQPPNAHHLVCHPEQSLTPKDATED